MVAFLLRITHLFSCCCLSSCYCHFSAQILFFISYSSVLVGQRALLFLLLPGEGREEKGPLNRHIVLLQTFDLFFFFG
uniref:Uncharacterized protein n=1 Tax=Meloidogyne enterolobii TaxID=390850 RepID=A0A6V7TVE5_MELEN|nr:unnamed protein product [Meloidogyne enterolobii]